MAWTDITPPVHTAVLATTATTELINAVNERVAILLQMDGRTPSYYAGAVGAGGGNFPVYADLRDVRLDTWWSNAIVPIRTVIENICVMFCRTHTTAPVAVDVLPFTLYTGIAQLLGDGSYGGTWLDTHRLQDTDVWLQMQEALDALVWPLGYFDADTEATGIRHQRHTAGSSLTPQNAWNASRGTGTANYSFGGWTGSGCWKAIDWTGALVQLHTATAGTWHECYCDFALPTPALASTICYYAHGWRIFEDSVIFTPTDPGAAMTDNHANSSTPTAWSAAWQNLYHNIQPCPTANTQFTLTWDPVTVPWTGSGSNGGDSSTILHALGQDFYTTGDLTALMTYG